jgi:hypothetical protein
MVAGGRAPKRSEARCPWEASRNTRRALKGREGRLVTAPSRPFRALRVFVDHDQGLRSLAPGYLLPHLRR